MSKTASSVAAAPLVRAVWIPPVGLVGDWTLPADANAVVLFAHGSGSSRLSPRNLAVAKLLHRRRLGTLLFDLLTCVEAEDRANLFDIALLARRLIDATDWVATRAEAAGLPIGYFGASTGAAAALKAAALAAQPIGAIVARGGRPDLAQSVLSRIAVPTLLIVGGEDREGLALNRAAYAELSDPKRLAIVPGAGHLFAEPGAIETVATLAVAWFRQHLSGAPRRQAKEG